MWQGNKEDLSQSRLRALVAQYNAWIEALTETIWVPDGTQSVIRPRTPFNQIISPIVMPEDLQRQLHLTGRPVDEKVQY